MVDKESSSILYYNALKEMKDAIQESVEDSYDPISQAFHLHPRSIVGGYALGAVSKQINDFSNEILDIIDSNISDDIKLANIEHICSKRKGLETEHSDRIERMFRISGINYNKELICIKKWEKEKDQHFD